MIYTNKDKLNDEEISEDLEESLVSDDKELDDESDDEMGKKSQNRQNSSRKLWQ